MEPIIIAATKSTPAVYFNAQAEIIEIKGESYPENASAFYEPIIQWVEQYLVNLDGSALLRLQITYLNTSSTRCMLSILDLFEGAYLAGKKVEVQWFYHPDDERSREAGEEFQEDFSFPFQILPDEKETV